MAITSVLTQEAVNRRVCEILGLCVVLSASVFLQARDRASPPKKPTPTKILADVFVLGDQVVQEQWPATLDLVNAPSDLKQIEPGQCIRFGVVATGDQRDQLLKTARLTFEFTFAGNTQTMVTEPPQIEKQIKPEGGDFVTQVLGAAGIRNPVDSLASLATSQPRWCAPIDVQDGAATIRGTVTMPNGKTVSLNQRRLQVKTFETARKQAAFTDMNTFGPWLQHYHAAPDPAQLLLGLRIVASQERARLMSNIMAFFVEALKANPPAAKELVRALSTEDRSTQIYAIPLLLEAGYAADPLLDGFKEEDKTVLRSVHLPDPFDLKPDQTLPNRMDMLWALFFASGRIEPVRTVASMLAWRDDYDNFIRVRESGQKRAELTDSIMRGVVYAAAGWSLNALSRNDGLVADYIDVLKLSPNTPAVVKAELANLYTNPAFTKK